MQASADLPIFVAFLNGLETVALLAVILVLFGLDKLPDLRRGFRRGIRCFHDEAEEIGRHAGYNYSKPVFEALTDRNDTVEFQDQRELNPIKFRAWKRAKNTFLRFCARIRSLFVKQKSA